MSSFFDLVASLQTSIDALDKVLAGGDTELVLIDGVNKDTISKAIKDNFSALKAMMQGRLAFSTVALMDADTGQGADTLAEVWNDSPTNNGLYGWSGTAWVKSTIAGPSNSLSKTNQNDAVSGYAVWQRLISDVLSVAPKNMVDKTEIRGGYYYSPSGNKISASPTYRITGFIPVVEGVTYIQSGGDGTGAVGYFTAEDDNSAVSQAAGNPFTVPIGQSIKFVAINITGNTDPSFDDSFQLEQGLVPTVYVSNSRQVPIGLIENHLDIVTKSYMSTVLTEKITTNLFNRQAVQYSKRWTPGGNAIISADSTKLVATEAIPVTEGNNYVISGENGVFASTLVDAKIGFLAAATDLSGITDLSDFVSTILENGDRTFQVPIGYNANFVILNLVVTDTLPYADIKGNIQLTQGTQSPEYQEYADKLIVKTAALPLPHNFSDGEFIFDVVSHNAIDLARIDYVNRYSTGAKNFQLDNLGLACSGAIPVKEGNWYTFSGDGLYPQGGYLSGVDKISANVVDNISFITPVDGVGLSFQVPTGLSITHVVLSLTKQGSVAASNTLAGTVQLELGEMVTTYQAYSLMPKIKQALIPAAAETSGRVSFDSEAWYKYIDSNDGSHLSDKLPIFRKHWLKRDKDLTVINTGTSLTARSTEHCSTQATAKNRPPLMHSYNFASLCWDKLAWDLQQYSRYDSGDFAESVGTFITSSNMPEWDDGPYRHGLTRYSDDAGASIDFTVPINAWQFNFIYRTDSLGTGSTTVSIAEGNGQVEVLNDSDVWVEANGFIFSMLEAAPVERLISVPKASDNSYVNRTIQSKSNTTYQKRLKMRCKSGVIDSRTASKAVTITNTATGRFMYWGVEWSPREFMITYINAARGSHNSQAEGTRGLPRYADNEIWGFKPDLMLFELPIHNDGASGAGVYTTSEYWGRLTNHFVFDQAYELSMKTRADFFGLSPEIAMFTSSISWNFNGIEDDGTLKYSEQGDGVIMTALDKYAAAHNWVLENHPEAVSINAAARWVEAGNAIFGNLKLATLASGRTGKTFTNEGSHWNNTGSQIIARAVLPVINFMS